MNYKKIYEDLVNKGKFRTLSGYKESHHIVPRCLGGSNDKENLVELTPEEHYLAHQLLVKVYPGNHKLVKAAAMMIPNRPSNKMYGWLRRKFSEAKSLDQSGRGNSQYGTRWVHDPLTKENKKIKGEPDIGWVLGKYKAPKVSKTEDHKRVDLKIKRDANRQNQIQIYRAYYEIYKDVGFEKFVELTGYSKSHANLVQRFATLLDEFAPQNGKRRG